jgi:hypothetical protein
MILRANLKKLDKGGMGSAGKDQSVISTYEAWKLAGHVDFYRLKNGIGHGMAIVLSPKQSRNLTA